MKITQEQITGFPWGRILGVHSIGGYDIIEAVHYTRGKRTLPETPLSFHPYVNGKDMGCYFPTLEHAIIGAIAYRHDGHSSRAAEYICRMIGIPETP